MPRTQVDSDCVDHSHAAKTAVQPSAEQMKGLSASQRVALAWHILKKEGRAEGILADFSFDQGLSPNSVCTYVFADGTLKPRGEQLLIHANAMARGTTLHQLLRITPSPLTTSAAAVVDAMVADGTPVAPKPVSTVISPSELAHADTQAATYLLSDPRHRDHALFLQASEHLNGLHGIDWTQEQRVSVAGAVVVAAKVMGLGRVDRLGFNRQARYLLTAEQRDESVTHRAYVETWTALGTPLEHSSSQCLRSAQQSQPGAGALGPRDVPYATPSCLPSQRRRS